MASKLEILRAAALAKMQGVIPENATPAASKQELAVVDEAAVNRAITKMHAEQEILPAIKNAEKVEVATLPEADAIFQRIDDLQEALQKQLPSYERLLFIIHEQLRKDEDLVQFLTEEQIGIICAGLAKKKDIVISVTATKKGSNLPSGKRIKDITAEDL